MDINDVKFNWKERTDVLSKMIRTFGKQKTAEQIDGFIDKLIAVKVMKIRNSLNFCSNYGAMF